MKLALAAFPVIAAVVPEAAQEEDFHRAKFPQKLEMCTGIRKTNGSSRDNDRFELHIQTNVTLASIGYRIVLTVIPMAPVRSCRTMRSASLRRAE